MAAVVVNAVPDWLPLESNPDVLNPFIHRLGCPEGWGFTDVFGLDDELLMMVPQPCVALCLLFPCAKVSKPRREDINARVAAAGGDSSCPDNVRALLVAPPNEKILFFEKDGNLATHTHPFQGYSTNLSRCSRLSPCFVVTFQVFFMQQHDEIGNACGTIAAIHAVTNASAEGAFPLAAGSTLEAFVAATKPMLPAERGWELARTKAIAESSAATAAAGETEGAGTNDANDSHFICFVRIGGELFELDGRTTDKDGVAFPVRHGPSTAESFLSDAGKVIREDFMARDPENVGFNVVALCQLG